jgi:hypothetical protein
LSSEIGNSSIIIRAILDRSMGIMGRCKKERLQQYQGINRVYAAVALDMGMADLKYRCTNIR